MRIGLLPGIFLIAWASSALAQYGGYDPCRPAPESGNAILALANLMGQAHREQACADLRRGQWADYNARQKAARDTADAAAQVAHEAERHASDAQAAQAAAQLRARRQMAAAEQHARQMRAASQSQAERDAALAERRHRLVYLALARAEQAPDNHCRQPELARGVMGAWDGLEAMKAEGVRVIDIEHLTTLSFDAANGAAECHGVFVTSKGWRIAGTATVKKNVAGDPMFVWERDADQDLSKYDPPRAAGPASPADGPAGRGGPVGRAGGCARATGRRHAELAEVLVRSD